MNVMRNSGSINVCKTNRNRPGAFTRIAKIITLLMVMLAATGCVSLDRALNPITNQTKHYTFNYQDVSSGGVLVAAVVDRYQEIDIVESIEISERVQRQFKSERKELDVSSARPFFSKFVTSEHSGTNEIVVKLGGERYSGNLPLTAEVGQNYYQEMMEMYQRERWISPELLEQVREAVPQRFLVMARIENTSQDRSSSCSVRSAYTEQKEREEKSGEEEDYDEIKYQITRYSSRYAEISIDVFDLAQDIIVWSATNDSGASRSNSYKSDYNVDDGEQEYEFPYPGYPSWYSAYYNTFYAFAVHLPHKSD